MNLLMPIARIAQAGITHPFGDSRTVTQAFPAAVPSNLSDPFLMCDHFDMPSTGSASHPDDFPIDWHPHRGMLVLTYLKTGVGRHADSMGNRETFATPGLQWVVAGSGIEHAEGGGTSPGVNQRGFQIWVNLPARFKMMDPSYGTESPEKIPLRNLYRKGKGEGFSFSLSDGETCETNLSKVRTRVLAGNFDGHIGPIKSIAKIQMLDLEIDAGGSYTHILPEGMDTCMLYIYDGAVVVNDSQTAKAKQIVLFDTSSTDDVSQHQGFDLRTAEGSKIMIFIGKKIAEPIAWRGPIVMNTQDEIAECFREIRSGRFPPVRVPWDYRRIDTKPTA